MAIVDWSLPSTSQVLGGFFGYDLQVVYAYLHLDVEAILLTAHHQQVRATVSWSHVLELLG
jgi:hypothetical protein